MVYCPAMGCLPILPATPTHLFVAKLLVFPVRHDSKANWDCLNDRSLAPPIGQQRADELEDLKIGGEARVESRSQWTSRAMTVARPATAFWSLPLNSAIVRRRKSCRECIWSSVRPLEESHCRKFHTLQKCHSQAGTR
jgi:hypothetical protein